MMIIAEEHDRLIDTLLWEVLGGQTPPDLTEKILAKAFPKRNRILRWTIPAVAATVLIGLALAGWMIMHPYPKPQVTGNYIVEGGGEVRRGTKLITQEKPAAVSLGGYCGVEIEPHSTLRIAGKKKAEEIVLEQGGVTCEVDPSEGSFSVRTEVGTVSVTGTTFTVRMGGGQMPGRQMYVRVGAGAVLVSGAWGETTLHAGEEKVFPKEGTESYIDYDAVHKEIMSKYRDLTKNYNDVILSKQWEEKTRIDKASIALFEEAVEKYPKSPKYTLYEQLLAAAREADKQKKVNLDEYKESLERGSLT